MKNWNFKMRDKILINILPFIIVAFFFASFLGYYYARQSFLYNDNLQKEQLENHILSSLHLIDAGFSMLEENLKEEMEAGIIQFKEEFERAGGNPDQVSLDELKALMGGKYDLIIIDSNTTIINSTIPEGIGFNFFDFDERLGENINAIRTGDSIQHERIRTNVGTGYLTAFTYLPTSDNKYILEIAYSKGGLGSIVSELSPLKITEQLKEDNPYVKQVRIFDAYGYEFTDSGTNYKPTDESQEIVEKAKKEKKFEIRAGNDTKIYLYIDLKDKQNVLSDNSKIVEISYDNSIFSEQLKKAVLFFILMGLIFVATMVFALLTLSKRITAPITMLTEAAKRISAGDYDVDAQRISRDEIGDLVEVFNKMTAKINEDFALIAYQKNELEDYNKNLEEKVDERTIELVRAKETIKKEKQILESLLDDTLSGYWNWEFETKHLYHSAGYKKMLGYEDFELGDTFEDTSRFFFEEDKAVVQESFSKHVESHGEIPFYNEVRFRHKDGSTVWVIFAGHVVEWRPDGQPVEMIGCQINITNLKMLEKSLKDERGLLKATLLSMGDGVITTDKDGNVGIVNPVAQKLTGWKQEEVFGKPFDEVFRFLSIDPEDELKNPISRVLSTGEAIRHDHQMILVSKDHLEKIIEENASPIKDENGTISGAVLVFRDFTERKEKQDRIEYLSLHDQLTGLYNRRYFEEELKRLDTARNMPLTIVMIDVNGLKLINDAFGHGMGDVILQRVAEIIKGECRGDDILARFGGDEFVILLPVTSTEYAERMVKRIYSAFEKEIIDSISVSVSCGWAAKQNDTESIAGVFKLAEDYMYRRKLSESQSMHYKTIDVILKTLHEKSEREKKHSERVGELCELIAEAMNFSQEDVKEFNTIGLMHDIGKIAIDLSILDKPDRLTELERAEIERHPELGYQILRSINSFAKLAEYVLSHHERWDGKGYPRKLKGGEIPLEARILAVADAYDSMTSDRAYRKSIGKAEALAELKKEAGIQFDPEIVRVFTAKITEITPDTGN
ncbi:MAG: diguanylate cyclase [Clostridia bacterium]|nr:diguanylate cyclase [Clostridia bacterium]